MQNDDPPADFETIASQRIGELRIIQPHGPYFLGGYCDGGLVALEMARQLEAVGETVACVILFATDGCNVWYRGMRRSLSRLARLFKLGEKMELNAFLGLRALISPFRNPFYFLQCMQGHAQRFLYRATGLKCLEPVRGTETRSVCIRRIDSIYIRASKSYIPRSCAAKIYSIWPAEMGCESRQGPFADWRRLSPGMEGYLVGGDHTTAIVNEDNLHGVAETMNTILNRY